MQYDHVDFVTGGEFSPLPPPPPELDDQTYANTAPFVPSWVPENYVEKGRVCRFSSDHNN